VRDSGFPHPKFVGRIAALLCAVVAAGGANAGASPVAPATDGPALVWAGREIHSLDPARLSGLASEWAGPPDQVLSNESTITRWAYVNQIVSVLRAPRTGSARVGQLTRYTADGFSSIYVVLRAHWDAIGMEWVQLRIPGRPNGRTGWVERSALGPFQVTHALLVVNREQMRMYFYRLGRRIWSAPIGVGKPSTPTPAGHFWINERIRVADARSGYYPYAFGTTDYSHLTEWPGGGVVGIHGPYYDPQSIPGQISHGCIRLQVADDWWLAAHLKLGTPVLVN